MNISVIKKALSILVSVLVCFSLFACSSEDSVEPTETTTAVPLQKIAVLSMELDENTSDAFKGFTAALSDNGYIKDDNYTLINEFCKAEEELASAAEALVGENPDVIFTIGVDAAIAAKNATAEIPVVFTCVNDPIGSGLVKSCEKPEANVTGVCDYPPVFEQIELIQNLYPGVNRIGCVYNGADEESIFTANLASSEAQALEVKFTMYPALTEGEYIYELEKALKKCDALYLPDDALVKACLSDVLDLANESKIPVFAESTELVEAGCLATCITDYEHLGYSAGELSLILLRSLKNIAMIPVEYASDCIAVINSGTQKAYKLTVPDDISEEAVFVKNVD